MDLEHAIRTKLEEIEGETMAGKRKGVTTTNNGGEHKESDGKRQKLEEETTTPTPMDATTTAPDATPTGEAAATPTPMDAASTTPAPTPAPIRVDEPTSAQPSPSTSPSAASTSPSSPTGPSPFAPTGDLILCYLESNYMGIHEFTPNVQIFHIHQQTQPSYQSPRPIIAMDMTYELKEYDEKQTPNSRIVWFYPVENFAGHGTSLTCHPCHEACFVMICGDM